MMLSWEEIVDGYIARYADAIRRTTAPLRECLGVQYFTYHRINALGHYTVLVDRPDFAELYVQQRLFEKDPYLRHPRVYASGICPIESYWSSSFERQVEALGDVVPWDANLLVIERQVDAVEFFGFSGRRGWGLQHTAHNHPTQLRAFGQYFKREMRPILQKMAAQPGLLPELKGRDFYTSDPIQPARHNAKRAEYLQRIGHGDELRLAGCLSRRERSVLLGLLDGETLRGTAEKLGLSVRTVEAYFSHAKDKLGCRNRRELWNLVRRLCDLGLLDDTGHQRMSPA